MVKQHGRTQPWNHYESKRSLVSSAATVLVALPILLLARGTGPSSIVIYSLLGGWLTFTLTHALTIYFTYRGMDAKGLRAAVLADRRALRKRDWVRDYVLGTGTLSFAASLAMMALIGVFALLAIPSVERTTTMLFMGFALVALAWWDMALTYALHYARLDATIGGLEFPGTQPPAFADYDYFASAVQATLGTTDVSLTHPDVRRTARSHSLLGLVYNSVIIALLVSLALQIG